MDASLSPKGADCLPLAFGFVEENALGAFCDNSDADSVPDSRSTEISTLVVDNSDAFFVPDSQPDSVPELDSEADSEPVSEGNLELSTFNLSALAASPVTPDRPGGPGVRGLGPFARMCAEVHLLILFIIASHSRINVPSSFQGLLPPVDVDGVVTQTQAIYKLGVESWPLCIAPRRQTYCNNIRYLS